MDHRRSVLVFILIALDFTENMTKLANYSITKLNRIAFECLDVNNDGFVSEVDVTETLAVGFNDVMDPTMKTKHIKSIMGEIKLPRKLRI